MTSIESSIQVIGGPTAILTIGGVRLLTDPTFDPAGDYQITPTRTLTKTTGPAVSAGALAPVDVVLLSHDQHPDNFDEAGRRYAMQTPTILTTPAAAERLGPPAVPLHPWQVYEIQRPANAGALTITAVPARHGPEGCESVTGPVTGFVISGQDLPTVYVSGDNASLDHVVDVAGVFPAIDVALLFAGAARTPVMDAFLTLTSDQAAAAAHLLGSCLVVPLHVEGWQHFTEGPSEVASSFHRAGLAERLLTVSGGATVGLPALSTT